MEFEKLVSGKTLLNRVVQKLTRRGTGSQTKIIFKDSPTRTAAMRHSLPHRNCHDAHKVADRTLP